jgi:hypothetical protein
MAWNSFFIPIDMVKPVLTRWTRFWSKMTVLTWNGLKTHFLTRSTWFDPYWPDGIGFDQKWRFWLETAWKVIFYPSRHGLTRIDPVDSVLTVNDGFDPKQPENSFFTLVDMVWPILTRWNRFVMERCGWLEKNIFLNFKLFLNFFWIFKNNNRNKMTFKKILVNPKLDYNSCPLFTMLTAQRHWKIHFLLTLHNKFCKEKRWKCWKIHKFFSWSNSYGRPAQMKKKHESVFNIDFVKYLKVISAMVLWNIWKWFQMSFVKYMKVISALVLFFKWPTRSRNTWKWFQHWSSEIHESDFNIGLIFQVTNPSVKYMKVISALILLSRWPTCLWNTWKWFQHFFFVKYMKVISALVLFSRWQTRLWNTWKWFHQWFYEIHESDFR